MGKKVKGIVAIIIAAVVVAGLHMYVFAPKQKQYKDYNAELQGLSQEYKSIVSKIKKDSDSSISSSESLPTQADQVIKVIQEKINAAREGFTNLDKKVKIIERFDPSLNYRDEVIKQIVRMKKVEAESKSTKLTVSSSWEVGGGITEGRFGTGFKAADGRAIAYANVQTHQVVNPRQGSIEFFVKPDWDPSDAEIHHKCLFMAIDSRKYTRDQIKLRMEADQEGQDTSNPMFERMNITQNLPMGAGPFQRDSMIAIYKGEGATLTFELRDYVKSPSTVTAYISDWKKGQWYHINAVWESKRQALYINGQNRGVPFGGGQSIRDARDVEEDSLLSGGGYGMGGGMMGGMGMGMMGGMGMGGMGMGGGMGGGMMGGGMGPTAGQALTANISLPSVVTGVYLGTDDEGGFGADCTFDDLRIQNRSTVSPQPNAEVQANESTMYLDHFEDELPGAKELPQLLLEIAQYQRQKSIGTINPAIREVYEKTYTMLKHSLGINDQFLASDKTTRSIRELYVLDYIRQNTGKSFADLVPIFQVDNEIMKNDSLLLHQIVEFQRLCYDLAQQAINDNLISINQIIYKGHGYNVVDKELEDSFKGDRSKLQGELMSEDNYLVKYDWSGGGGGMGMGGMGMGGMGMGGMGMGGMGMGGMGMGMMGMGGMGGGGLMSMFRDAETTDIAVRQKAKMIGDLFWTDQVPGADPEKVANDAKLTIEEKMLVVRTIIDKVEKYKTYQKYYKDDLIPPEVIEKFNKTQEDSGNDYYIKRSLTMDVDADYKSLMRYLYNIEYGSRVQTINSINITNKESETVNALMDIESHSLNNVTEEKIDAPASSGQMSMN